MHFSARQKARKPRGGSSHRDGWSWVYAVLCVGLVGFFLRFWWHSALDEKPVPKGMSAVTNAVFQSNRITSPSPIALPTNPPPDFPVPEPLAVPVPVPQPIPPSQPQTQVPPRVTNQFPEVVPAPVATPPAKPSSGDRPVESILEAQIALVRQGISSGSIDGSLGLQTRSALSVFQKLHRLPVSGALDANTRSRLLISLPPLVPYTITSNDLQRLLPLSQTWLGKSEQQRLDFEGILELLGEKSFSHPRLIRDLNPATNWKQVTAGTRVTIPHVQYPTVVNEAAFVKISLRNRVLEAFDSDTNLLVHFPCSIGSVAEKRPVGQLRVELIIPNPNYTFNPSVFPESEEAQRLGRKLIIPAGPNNPVGVAWIGLNRPGYGIHGTPSPEQVGRTESHGCFRLANWNAEHLAQLVWVGMPVFVEP